MKNSGSHNVFGTIADLSAGVTKVTRPIDVCEKCGARVPRKTTNIRFCGPCSHDNSVEVAKARILRRKLGLEASK